MNIVIHPSKLSGDITVIPSKSQAHRLLILAAFADGKTRIHCPSTNSDIEATAQCLRGLGAKIAYDGNEYSVVPASSVPKTANLYCRDSGSTLRFLLPVAGALGVEASFHMEGRLPQRPLSPLWEEMERMGCILSRPTENTILCQGRLRSGHYQIPGNVSSQFVSGLLFAKALLPGSSVEVTGNIESVPYIRMTDAALALFGPDLKSPGSLQVEGDWSNAAFFLGANALGASVKVNGLSDGSPQGDREVQYWLSRLPEKYCTIDAANIPDLVPILAVVAAAKHGACFTNIQRLRLKESDRVATVAEMIRNLGGSAEVTETTLRICGTGLVGGTVDSFRDHRIAMSAAIAAICCPQKVTILGAECVKKSYPNFWTDYARLGGQYEQYLR